MFLFHNFDTQVLNCRTWQQYEDIDTFEYIRDPYTTNKMAAHFPTHNSDKY